MSHREKKNTYLLQSRKRPTIVRLVFLTYIHRV